VYVVDVETGTVTNLTSDSHTHDFAPMWTLDGSKIVFLSTDYDHSLWYDCGPGEDALPQMKVVNADGSGEHIIYDPEFYYPHWQVSVLNSGQIIFVSDMASKTRDEYYDSSVNYGKLYKIDLVEETLVEILATVDDREPIRFPVWSPNEEYIAYHGYSRLIMLNVTTEKVFIAQEIPSIEYRLAWSPDGQRIAAIVSNDEYGAIDSEEHIHIFDIQSRTFQPLIQK
jgi:Tol biopolymer transport system component